LKAWSKSKKYECHVEILLHESLAHVQLSLEFVELKQRFIGKEYQWLVVKSSSGANDLILARLIG